MTLNGFNFRRRIFAEHWPIFSNLWDRVCENILRCAEILGIIISIGLDTSHMNHFTWWGLIWYGLYAFSGILNLDNRTWGAAIVTCTTVLVGVVALSVFRCSMLSDAVEEYGASGYLLGNFAVHYWPCLRLYCFAPDFFNRSRYARSEQKEVMTEFWRQAALGFVPLLVYVSWTHTERVYGCNIPAIGVLAGTLFVPVVMGIVWYWRFVRKFD
tara:strand:- start:495 stop:1133 length:639 start_codon:yes stop_codon:yes gene_type:complete